MTNQQGRRRRHAGGPGHPQGVGHVRAHAVRELARRAEHERAADQGGARAGLPQLLLLQVRARLRRVLVLHDLHDRHQRGRQDHVQRPLPGGVRRGEAATSCRSRSTARRSTSPTPTKYYQVSTVNYLAAGSCNFNDGGVSLWPLDQIVNDTQFYVRDAVIDYITAMGTVSPAIEGRLAFVTDTTAPVITITTPEAKAYLPLATSSRSPSRATDAGSGVAAVDGQTSTARPSTNGQVIDLRTLAARAATPFTVHGDRLRAATATSESVTFTINGDRREPDAARSNLYYAERRDHEARASRQALSRSSMPRRSTIDARQRPGGAVQRPQRVHQRGQGRRSGKSHRLRLGRRVLHRMTPST